MVDLDLVLNDLFIHCKVFFHWNQPQSLLITFNQRVDFEMIIMSFFATRNEFVIIIEIDEAFYFFPSSRRHLRMYGRMSQIDWPAGP